MKTNHYKIAPFSYKSGQKYSIFVLRYNFKLQVPLTHNSDRSLGGQTVRRPESICLPAPWHENKLREVPRLNGTRQCWVGLVSTMATTLFIFLHCWRLRNTSRGIPEAKTLLSVQVFGQSNCFSSLSGHFQLIWDPKTFLFILYRIPLPKKTWTKIS